MGGHGMAKTARIATTVTARFFPSTGIKDAFWIDGRLSGRRETRAADITLDREDRGAFLAVFAHLAMTADAEAENVSIRRTLERMQTDVKHSGKNIDAEINELADCAVEVCGRISLSREGARQPYFAGIIVKDNEVAAVTMGRGCAYLYRGDALYPLTNDDFPLEAVDALGNVVHNLEAYCAGSAGTVRYSNIAPLLPDDCLIVCNRDVMDALGQKEVLRMLYEAEDQCDAAGLVTTSAASKMPGVPIQFMIGFAESISMTERNFRSAPSRSGRTVASVAAGTAAAGTAAAAAATAFAAEATDSTDSYEVMRTAAPIPTRRTAPPPPRPDHIRRELPRRRGPGPDPRAIALVLVILAVAAGAIYALYTMLHGGGGASPTPTTAPTATPYVTAEPTVDPSLTPSVTGDVTPTAGVGTPTPGGTQTYTVVSGDSLYKIAGQFYGSQTPANVQLIIDANKATYPNIENAIQVGWVLTIPPKPTP